MTVYCLTNRITGEKYVGQTTMRLSQRVSVHRYLARKAEPGYPLGDAMKKYGPVEFTAEVLQECLSHEELDAAEIMWIRKLNTLAPHGYNLRSGGSRGRLSESTKAKLRGRVVTPEWRAKLSRAACGRKLSPSHRAASIAALRRAKRRPNPGEQNGRAKLTWDKVGEIRQHYHDGLSQQKIADMYGVHQMTVSFIVRGVHWKTGTAHG